MAKKLKPCPFCGGKAELNDYGVGTGGWMISCVKNCGVLMHAFCKKAKAMNSPKAIHDEIRKNVIKAWNKRTAG